MNGSACSNFSGAFGLKPDPAFPALKGLIEPNAACVGAFLRPAAVSLGATSRRGRPTSQLVRLALSGSIRRAKIALSLRGNAAWK